MKWVFGLLVLGSLMFFAFMQWGGQQGGNSALQAEPPLNADKIRLLPESAVQSASAVKQDVSAACMEWGSFSEQDLPHAVAAMAPMKLGSRLSQRQTERVNGYWVYLPPFKSNDEVEKKIAEIKELGLDEYFVVQDEGKWHNAISLGVFKTPDAAHKFRDSVKAKGLKAAKAGERMSKRLYTVFVLKDPDAALTARMAALQKDFPGSELKAVACTN